MSTTTIISSFPRSASVSARQLYPYGVWALCGHRQLSARQPAVPHGDLPAQGVRSQEQEAMPQLQQPRAQVRGAN